MSSCSRPSELPSCPVGGELVSVEQSPSAVWARFQPYTKYLPLLVGLWLLRFAFLGILQQTTTMGVGLNVWPAGEDINWLCLMEEKPRLSLITTFWALDRRNPFSAWWYFAAKPLLLSE